MKRYGVVEALGFDFKEEQEIFILPTVASLALGLTQLLFKGHQGLGHEADHLLPSRAKLRMCVLSYASTPLYVFMMRCLVMHRDNFNFTKS
jgi:hypothetical protein